MTSEEEVGAGRLIIGVPPVDLDEEELENLRQGKGLETLESKLPAPFIEEDEAVFLARQPQDLSEDELNSLREGRGVEVLEGKQEGS